MGRRERERERESNPFFLQRQLGQSQTLTSDAKQQLFFRLSFDFFRFLSNTRQLKFPGLHNIPNILEINCRGLLSQDSVWCARPGVRFDFSLIKKSDIPLLELLLLLLLLLFETLTFH